jgi:hypothetical protein
LKKISGKMKQPAQVELCIGSSRIIRKYYTTLKGCATEKHPSLFFRSIGDEEKNCNIALRLPSQVLIENGFLSGHQTAHAKHNSWSFL